ncbi:MAG: Hsp70 family protein [Deltaproteobacteria bacterium]|nr:Hsp70 family protein [Deltaproteobacteria bacterium]
MSEPVYIIGIDLGTTNSVAAYTEVNSTRGESSDIKILKIPQLVGPGTVEKREILPSFILMNEKNDAMDEALNLPWDNEIHYVVGERARDRGAEIPGRLISSSKSWLCNTMIDRNKPVLPWGGENKEAKLSPVEASAAILRHIRDAWNNIIAGHDEKLLIQNQEIFLTVPASFDAVARELTVKSATLAGLSNVSLLEEPQAAFYAWIESSGNQWRDSIKEGDLVLVCDIGGGTSDFSLINVSDNDGELLLERIAVGDHLLVGGDNMDLALAYSVSKQMAEKGTKLDSWQMRGLWHSCRKAKENVLSDSEKKNYPVTILGRGSSLIGGTIKTELSMNDVQQVILDGFFPKCEITAEPITNQKTGLKEIGLSYEADPAITHHLAAFLGRHKIDGESNRSPNAIIFNGGVMKADPVRKRIKEVLSSWAGYGSSSSIKEIDTKDFDLSVARGAVYYGLARRGDGIRIRSGLGRSYYIGIAASMPAVPGMPAPTRALCVAPFGMEEGAKAKLENQEFTIVVGEPVKFDFLGSSLRPEDSLGTVVDDWEDEINEINEIATIETTLDGDYGSVIPVNLEIDITEVGTLELWCVAREDDRRWKLEFNVREKENFGPS